MEYGVWSMVRKRDGRMERQREVRSKEYGVR